MKLCTVVWGRKTKIEYFGSKSDNVYPYLPPISPNFTNSNAFQWDGLNTALSTPVDRLLWLIPHTMPLGNR